MSLLLALNVYLVEMLTYIRRNEFASSELTLSSRKSLSYTANQCTVFYMIETSVMKELTFSIPPKTENLLIGYRKAEIS